ncbi:TPA: hypothetical protein N0F65_009520 [Lagenidium giganteum]|uniref:Uncharacterized protein n=1 Tax=Lagenidium giganteum TaxID=4803 RepID=A0AAV2YWY1_9STRA|nr:TPA: hypothetical protein N0F65_009520 [Lagenidium giganteum]
MTTRRSRCCLHSQQLNQEKTAMGRVSCKRKIKQVDPFFNGKRDNGKKPKAYDLPPTESKRSKKRKRKQVDEAAIEQYVTRISTVDAGASSEWKQQKVGVGKIREGETMKEFQKRISTEVKRVIYDETKNNRRSKEKRKEYLSKKKQKAKEKKMTEQERYEMEYQASGSTKKDFFEGAEKVRFGERVDAPPVMPKLKGIFAKRAAEKAKGTTTAASKIKRR